MKIGQRINVWVVGEGPVKLRAHIVAIRLSQYGPVPMAIRIVSASGRLSDTLVRSGQFVVIHDQTLPPYEAQQ